MQANSDFVTLNGLRFHYREWGTPGAPAIVLLHGLRAYAETWNELAGNLEDRYHLYALDQRGRGQTDWDPEANYYTDAYLDDVHALVDHLALERFILIGHSMGGTTAYVYAAQHPERLIAAVIEDSGPLNIKNNAGAARIRQELMDTPVEFDDWDVVRTYWQRLRPGVSGEALEQRLALTFKEIENGKLTWIYDFDGVRKVRLAPDPARIVDLWPVIDNIECPTLLLTGANSDFVSAATATEVTERNAKIRWAEIPNASHYVHDDNFAAFYNEVNGFLSALNGP